MSKLFRSGLVAAFLGAIALGVWFWLTSNETARLARELAELQVEMNARIAERDAMIARLSRTHRKGVLEVLDQPLDADGRVVQTQVRFVELDDSGREIGRMTATVPGDVVFIDGWTAKFENRLVAEGHPLMGKTLILLKRM